jgi:hypothetical protein
VRPVADQGDVVVLGVTVSVRTVRWLVATVLAGLAPLSSLPAAAATDDYLQVLDVTFPTRAEARFSDTYDACRSGCSRQHGAADLMGEKMWPEYAMVDGVVCSIDDGDEDGYGRHLTLCGDDGREYRYLHLNNDTPGTDDGAAGPEHVYGPGIRHGVRVDRGQLLAYMGDSGNAEGTSPHLHLDIFDDDVVDPYGEHRINPYPSLVAALQRGDVADGSVAPGDPVQRVAGGDRVATAIELSRQRPITSATVVLARSDDPTDALVAGPLAGVLDAPVLITPPDVLDPRVLAEVSRRGATSVVVVGVGPSTAVVHVLRDAGLDVRRLAGTDRFGTAEVVARAVWGATDTTRTALLALGEHPVPSRQWPDAMMASYLGAATGQPVLLTGPDALPTGTAALLADVRVTVVGGSVAIPDDVVSGLDVRRLAGSDRYATSTAVTDDLRRVGAVDVDRVWAATGTNWPDAITAGPVVAARGEALVLVDGSGGGASANTSAWMHGLAEQIAEGRVIGGTAAVAPDALTRFGLDLT